MLKLGVVILSVYGDRQNLTLLPIAGSFTVRAR